MSRFAELGERDLVPIWAGIVARGVEGERVTLAVIELDADSVVAEHAHENEQVGIAVRGSGRFRIGDEVREVTAGTTWSIPPNVPHELHVGPEGAVVVEAFAPRRTDWDERAREAPRPPVWP